MRVSVFVLTATLLAGLWSSQAFAGDFMNPDEYFMEIKGYSVEEIEPAMAMQDRMQGRYPAPDPGFLHQMLFNAINNDFTGAKRPHTYDRVIPPPLPLHRRTYPVHTHFYRHRRSYR